MKPARLLLLTVSVLLGSCGGGGESERTLAVDFRISPNYAYLWRSTGIDVTASGLEGNSPVCVTAASNPFPSGLSFESNSCRISGIPTAATFGTVIVRLSVPGFQGQVEKAIVFSVLGPPIEYAILGPVQAGAPVVFAPVSRGDVPVGTPNWTPISGETVSYTVSSGQLPPGLVLDPNTGVISGSTPPIVARYEARIEVNVRSSSRNYTATSGLLNFQVR